MISLDLLYIQNNGIDVISPSMAMTEITSTVCDMLEQNMKFVKKNGLTQLAKDNRERLLHLLDITELFNKISCDNATLKTYNNHLLVTNQRIMREINEIKRQENMANSI